MRVKVRVKAWKVYGGRLTHKSILLGVCVKKRRIFPEDNRNSQLLNVNSL